ncbi:hypothetical protein D9619_003485 [Psilocybe cf. subviscida]|uniref:BZIP domain-containing protein n=1 Tax=Psilocybe cf. subviscida TaxID=2480587 RepID=A0A8H5AYI4_9AGAR|nr:hypothetical protein D9619_003485 [Psilocybe cf. subviscida]
MLALKSEVKEDLVSLTESAPAAQQELSNWERLVFAFDMDHEKAPNPRSAQRSRSMNAAGSSNSTQQRQRGHTTTGVSEYDGNALLAASRASMLSNVQDAALLAQFAAAATGGAPDVQHAYANMMAAQNSSYPSMGPAPGFYNNFLHHNPMPVPQLPPLSSLDFHWDPTPPQHQLPSHHFGTRPHADPSTGLGASNFLQPQTPQTHPQPSSSSSSEAPRATGRRGAATRSQTGEMPPPASTSGSSEQGEVDVGVLTEEKRRRNTAASARFRVKKKHKTLSLERSVTELTGRAEELEREASDLRRENGWLKEIVMLKGTRFAANNQVHRQALSQAAPITLAGGAPPAGGPSNTAIQEEPEEESDESDSDGQDPKGKGKA